ncbi:hypothetical protein BRD19_07540 [Halobacteriales archaeon SW_7_65_23]|nr:MAG: hypothetical protein BRD19_07540 [Halobacteriales archaeon SW_7_65_23]
MEHIEISSYRSCLVDCLGDTSIDHWRVRTDDPEVLSEFIDILQEEQPAGKRIEWLCDQEIIKGLKKNFVRAAKASDLVTESTLTIRESTDAATNTPTVLVSPEKTVALLSVDGGEAVRVDITEEAACERLWEKYQSEWDIAMPHSIDTPPYSRLLTMAEQKLGPDVGADVTVALLVGAKHQLLLNDIVDWAETSTLATQGTVSKLKQRLEEFDIITTESESVGVGRPRQRLVFADDSLESLPADELVAHVQGALA